MSYYDTRLVVSDIDRLTGINRYQKGLRIALACMVILFTMGLDNVFAAYSSVISSSQMNVLSSFNSAVVPDQASGFQNQGTYHTIKNGECTPDMAFSCEGEHRSHINPCELQINFILTVELYRPVPINMAWLKSVHDVLYSIERPIIPKPPKQKSL